MELFWTPTHEMRKLIIALLVGAIVLMPAPSTQASTIVAFQAEVWVDNWFALYVNGKKVGEDSVAYNTEKSFNSTVIKFSATYPFEIGVLARDFMENESGLEYIGKSNQQIGDAGLIIQVREIKSGKVVAASSSKWKSLVVQKAPTNPECVTSQQPLTDCKRVSTSTPAGWSLKTFKDTAWSTSTEYSEAAVGVKDGYFDYKWNSSAKLIWSSDLKLDNTVLFRSLVTGASLPASKIVTSALTLGSPDFEINGKLPKSYTCDGSSTPPSVTWSGVPDATQSLVLLMSTLPGPPRPGEVENPNHAYLLLYNIDPASKGAINPKYPGTMGMNFKDKSPGYTAPCSQGPGEKKYTFTLYALNSKLSISAADATETNILKAIEGKVIEKAELSVLYARS